MTCEFSNLAEYPIDVVYFYTGPVTPTRRRYSSRNFVYVIVYITACRVPTSTVAKVDNGGEGGATLLTSSSELDGNNWENAKSVYDFTVMSIRGEVVPMEKYRGYVLLIVNVASKCILANIAYSQLVILHNRYYKKGLRILAFPCNQFRLKGSSEPGTNAQIRRYVRKKKFVKFDLFEKGDVNGEFASPLWKYLARKSPGIFGSCDIKWNFTKFLVDRRGNTVKRSSPFSMPIKLEPYVEEFLKKT